MATRSGRPPKYHTEEEKREAARESVRLWRQKNADKARETAKIYRKKHIDKNKESQEAIMEKYQQLLDKVALLEGKAEPKKRVVIRRVTQ